MEQFQIVIYKVLEIAQTRISFGQYSFTFFELWLAFFGVEIIAYIFWTFFEEND